MLFPHYWFGAWRTFDLQTRARRRYGVVIAAIALLYSSSEPERMKRTKGSAEASRSVLFVAGL